MDPGTSRRRFGLVLVVALLATAFALNSVYGQRFRPPIGPQPPIGPRPPFGPQPQIGPQPPFGPQPQIGPQPPFGPQPRIGPQPPAGGRMVFTCLNCGKKVGEGSSEADAPERCPYCRVRFTSINGKPMPLRIDPIAAERLAQAGSTLKIVFIVGSIVAGVLALVGGTVVMIFALKSKGRSRAKRRRNPDLPRRSADEHMETGPVRRQRLGDEPV